MSGYSFSATVTGGERLIQQLEHAPEIARDVSKYILDMASKMGMGKAREFAPIRKGTLRNSITAKTETRGGQMVGVIGTNIAYAKYQEFGTGLFAEGPTTGRIKHGGIKPKRFMRRGLEVVQQNMNAIIRSGEVFAVKRIFGR